VAGCARSEPTGLGRLRPCASTDGPTDAFCGSLPVYEDRAARSGRRISLNIVVLPSVATEAQPDPLVFLAGGPGQAAAQMARDIREIFHPILRRRDIVLVDQRGTGKSNPLNCRSESNSMQELIESEDAAVKRLEACLAGYDADVRMYTTTVAMDDLDDVRAYLSYDLVNLYGGSYGTRAALVYARRHGAHVRSMVLDGVAPTDMRIPLFAARDAQRALDKLLTDCEADATCHALQPGLATRVRALIQRLNGRPARVEVMHPRTGLRETVTIEGRLVAARDAQRALDKLLADCEADAACHALQPGLATRVRALIQRLNGRPARVEVMHPRTGLRETVTIEGRLVASVLFSALHSPLTASLVPSLIAKAEQNEFQTLLALAYAGDASGENMSIGMQLSVLCSEDATRISGQDVGRESAATVFGLHLSAGQLQACGSWPRGEVGDDYFKPVVSDIPALVLSGDLDPVTPPGWGDAVAQHLRNSRHITVPATGHGVISTACGQQLVEDFIERGSAADLDTSCVSRVRRPPFFLTPSGPSGTE